MNLQVEKKIWEVSLDLIVAGPQLLNNLISVQTRLIEENKNLTMEHSRLSDLMVNIQIRYNDLDHSGENDCRHLEIQV
jgi:nucleoprotein TPR